MLPGVATPTEAMAALAEGVDVVKLFPAGPLGGPSMVAALAGPFPRLRLVPTGGIGVARRELRKRPGRVAAGVGRTELLVDRGMGTADRQIGRAHSEQAR